MPQGPMFTAMILLLAIPLLVGVIWYWWQESWLQNFRANQGTRMTDLDGLGQVSLPTHFKRAPTHDKTPKVLKLGSTMNPGSNFLPLAEATNPTKVAFRYLQGDYYTLGGQHRIPVGLDLVLYNHKANVDLNDPADTTLTVDLLLTPTGPQGQPLPFSEWNWQTATVTINGQEATLRSHRSENANTDKKPSVLAILVVPAMHVRLDLLTWAETYQEDAARELLTEIAQTLSINAAAREKHFQQLSPQATP